MNQTLCRDIVVKRSGRACEIRNLTVCEGKAANASHRKPAGQGGEWTPSNILHACGSGTTGCHGWIEHNPAIAQAYGFRLWRNQDPATTPVLHGVYGRVILHDDGTHTPAPFVRDRAWSEPEGWAERALYADDSLPHQIRLTNPGNEFYVGCTCGWTRELHGPDEIAQAARIYRNEHAANIPTQARA